MSIKKAIAAGHICLDITPAFKSKEEKNIKDLFRPGQLIAMDAAKVSLGGSVSNTGVGMKRLGADVELMGMVGDDAFGQMVLNELEKYGASPESMIVRKGVGTSYSVILAPAGIDRIKITLQLLPFSEQILTHILPAAESVAAHLRQKRSLTLPERLVGVL